MIVHLYKLDTWFTQMMVKGQGQIVGLYTGVVCTISSSVAKLGTVVVQREDGPN